MSLFFQYFFRLFLKWYGIILGVIILIIALFDLGELVRRSAHKPLITFPVLIEMVLLKLPFFIQKLLPFITLFSAMATFWKAHKTQELLAFQSAGISIWQFLYPMGMLLVIINAFILLFFHPLGASMMNRLGTLETYYFKGNNSKITIAKTGFWVRQLDPQGYIMVRADVVDLENLTFVKPTFIKLDNQNCFKSRFDADQAVLKQGYWHLQNVSCVERGKYQIKAILDIPTFLTKAEIIDSTIPPDYLSLWQIPRFVGNFKNLGLSTTKYWVYWHDVLARPFSCLAMMVIAACIAMRVNRHTTAFKRISLGSSIGFLTYIFCDVSLALGYSATIPTALCVWGPIGIILLLGATLLIHLQDG